jgi:hypothetical protein
MNRRRLEGEAIRDAMLVAADRLSLRKGGPGVMAPLPQELLNTLRKDQWKVTGDEEDHRRRSVYLFVRRNLRYPLFDAFDRPDTNASCPRRNRSTTAPQALVLLNSEFSFNAARDLAGYLFNSGKTGPQARIDLLYQRTLGRSPTSEERAASEVFLKTQAAIVARGETRPQPPAVPLSKPSDIEPKEAMAWINLCLAMFNLNEFVYID